jgi:UDP-glucose 4-epimerase
MPYITQTAYGIREKVNVFGGDYNTPDGTAIRDYIHVVDLADAHILALERMMHGRMNGPFEIFNLGTGRGFSVLEMLNTFTQVTGVNVPYQIVQRRSGDIEQIWADCSLANKELGWKAGRSIQDMVADAWKWENYYRKTVQNIHSNGI